MDLWGPLTGHTGSAQSRALPPRPQNKDHGCGPTGPSGMQSLRSDMEGGPCEDKSKFGTLRAPAHNCSASIMAPSGALEERQEPSGEAGVGSGWPRRKGRKVCLWVARAWEGLAVSGSQGPLHPEGGALPRGDRFRLLLGPRPNGNTHDTRMNINHLFLCITFVP